jgi:hypothetical protein
LSALCATNVNFKTKLSLHLGFVNRASAILLSFLLLAATFPTGICVLAFEMNRGEIVEEYCVERESEANCCKGSCFFDQNLSNALDHNPQDPLPKRQVVEELTYLTEIAQPEAPQYEENNVSQLAFFSNDLISDPHCGDVFHPPESIAYPAS